MILLGSYVCYTTNTLDTIEAFIAETYVATKSMCYSTSQSALLESVLANAPMKCVCLTARAVLCGALYSYLCRR